MRKALSLSILSALLGAAGCSNSTEAEFVMPDLRVPPEPVSIDKNDYPVFPDADAGADPAVPAEEGGARFTGEGWETNTDFDFIGDPRAVKGGTYREGMPNFPGTLANCPGPEHLSLSHQPQRPLGRRPARNGRGRGGHLELLYG